MKLFESTWREGYEYFERVYCTDLKRSIKRKVDISHEWYEPSTRGHYKSVLDASITLDKKQGRSKDARGHYGVLDPMYRNIRDNYWNVESENSKYNKNPRVWWLDIETRSGTVSKGFPVPELALEPICMIQIYDSVLNQVIMIGTKEWKHKDKYKDKFECEVKYIVAKDEIELIKVYIEFFKKLDPLIIHAWNGLGFDYPYLHNRFKNLGFDVNELSNHGKVTYSANEFQGRIEFKVQADGHFYIDLMEVYQKFVFGEPPASFALDNIAEIVLNEKKVDHSEYIRFDDFYTGEYVIPDNPTEEQKNSEIYQLAIKEGISQEVRELGHSEFCFYSYKDPILIKKIDEARNLTKLMIMISEKMGVQISDSLGTVKPWAQYLSNVAIIDAQVMPPQKENAQPHVVGGYVRDPSLGRKKWVISSDVNSMYPLLGMAGFNMSPETFLEIHQLPPSLRDLVLTYFTGQDEGQRLELTDDVWETVIEELQEHNIALGINGAAFDKSSLGMIPKLVQEIYSDRKKARAIQRQYNDRALLIEKLIHDRL